MIVISGGQTGADIAGLETAVEYGFQTGGTAPYKYMTTSGSNYDLKYIYNLVESEYGYKRRTIMNVGQSDATIIICSKPDSPGTRLTIKTCVALKKPYVVVLYKDNDIENWLYQPFLKQCLDLLSHPDIKCINIAGNSEVSCEYAYMNTKFFLSKLFSIIKKNNKNDI